MKISQHEHKRLANIIEDNVRQNKYKEQDNIKNVQLLKKIVEAEKEIDKIKLLLTEFNLKYKTDINIYLRRNSIEDDILEPYKKEIDLKYNLLIKNITQILLIESEKAETYEWLILVLNNKFNIQLN